jgi:methylenetetrahydrofolate--tRNA-(uracil-5-)-methyltransferase
MNVNFGLFPPITEGRGGRERKLAYTERAKRDLEGWHRLLTEKNKAA